MQYKFCLSLLFITIFFTANSQNLLRDIAILDLTDRNGETNQARLISSTHMIDVAGVPSLVTDDLNLATQHTMIFCTALINPSTFTIDEEALLIEYVNSGGTLVIPRLENDRLFDLFGIESYQSSKLRVEIEWETSLNIPSLKYIDEPEEQTVSLGRSDGEEIFKTLGYETSSGETLAYFKDGSSAVVQNNFGQGRTITVGLSWKDIILRNQINRDYEAQRITSNGFEPTTDVFMLFIRSLYSDLNPYAVWKNTSPENSTSTLMITHDIDSKTGMDSLNIFVDYESANDIEATYNVTLKYFEDALSSAFYTDKQDELQYIITKGHQIQSHSVGHFFDFADDDIISKGQVGNTKQNYNPYNDGDITTGATVFGECEVSKNELESDFNIDIRTFRAGHLAYPKDLVEVLEELEYEYNSSYSACDVLTNFPYQNVIGRSFSQRLSSVYEIPVVISDVFSSDPITASNYQDKAAIWIETALKNNANGSPTVLLVHPNRSYKLEGINILMEGISNEKIQVMEIGKFGDFWKERKGFQCTSAIENNSLTITIPSTQDLTNGVSLIIDNGQDLSEMIVQNELNESVDYTKQNWRENDLVIYFGESLTSIKDLKFDEEKFNVFPNPVDEVINIETNNISFNITNISLLNMNGQTLFSQDQNPLNISNKLYNIDLSTMVLASGMYFVVIKSDLGASASKRVILSR